MDFGKIFSVALKYPLDAKAFVLLFAVNVVFSLSSIQFLAVDFSDTAVLENITTPFFAIIAASVLATTLLMGLYTDNAEKYFRGKRETLAKSVIVANRKFPRLLATLILMGASIILPLLLALSGAAGAFAGIALSIIVVFLVFLAPYSVVLTKNGVIGSFRDSYRVVVKNKLNWLIFLAIYFAINMAVSLASITLALAEASAITILAENAISTYVTLFGYSAFTNFYLIARKPGAHRA